MANYYASCRSNYFKVKDVEAFLKWLDTVHDVELTTQDNRPKEKYDNDTYFALLGNNADGGGWPSWRMWDEDGNEIDEDLDLTQELSKHLADGSVAVLMEAGAEKLRYISGYAIAVNNTGKEIVINLYDIYDKAKEELGGEVTHAEY